MRTDHQQHTTCLVSACLVGLCTRYDGQSKASAECRRLLRGLDWIPVCPEQLGGLPTPRPAAELVGGDGTAVLDDRARVVDRLGRDVSHAFILGARQVLLIARARNASLALLKAKSPSCGCGGHGVLGVTAALLRKEGITCREI